MISAPASARHIHAVALLIVLSGCRVPDRHPVAVVDLIDEFDRAEKRPSAPFAITDHRIGDVARPSIVAPVPSRLTWSLPLPARGVFRAFVALPDPSAGPLAAPVRLRINVSDHRISEALGEIVLTPAERRWLDLRVDLSAYAGWKWSLFYRPDRVTWRLNLAADAIDAPATAIWGSPAILTDTDAAREYARRRQSPAP